MYLEQKALQSEGKAKMLRRKLGFDKPREERGLGSFNGIGLDLGGKGASGADGGSDRRDRFSGRNDEDDEAEPIEQRAGGKRSRSIRFKDEEDGDFDREDKDTPPTRSRSRKARSRVAFGDDKPAPALKSALNNAGGSDSNSKSANFLGRLDTKSRGSSRSRSRGVASRSVGRSSSRNRAVHPEPKHGVGGQGTDPRREAFEAKFDKYRTNKRTKDAIEKRSKLLE